MANRLDFTTQKLTVLNDIFRAREIELREDNTSIMVMTPHQILGVARVAIRKEANLKWYFRKGKARTGKMLSILNDFFIVIEERGMWQKRARMIDVRDVFAVSFL